jgi:hypothetical protein
VAIPLSPACAPAPYLYVGLVRTITRPRPVDGKLSLHGHVTRYRSERGACMGACAAPDNARAITRPYMPCTDYYTRVDSGPRHNELACLHGISRVAPVATSPAQSLAGWQAAGAPREQHSAQCTEAAHTQHAYLNEMAHNRMLVGDRETLRAAPARPQSGRAPEQRGMQQAACAAGWLSKIGVHHGGA